MHMSATRQPDTMHLRYVALGVPDLEASSAFFTAVWGLTAVEGRGETRYFRTQRDEPFQLALRSAPSRRIDAIAFSVEDRARVDDLARDLGARSVSIASAPALLDQPGGGYGFRFVDPDGRTIELSAEVAMPGPLPAQPAVPAYLAHVVLNTPDLERATAFYTDLLGFRISDRSADAMTFLRCDRDHHALAFNRAPHASYNHTSWQMRSIDDLFRAQGRIRAAGTPLAWGTGRHAPGKQVFNYFVEPSGFVVETIADGEMISDEAAWVPQTYGRTPEAMDLWNTSGPPSAEVRAAMLGTPDHGLAPAT
jgi:catechol 2,3-dioxygenase-like lactoylglutathione lyase family enzyme